MKLPRLTPGDAIEVIWIDSNFLEAGWKTIDDLSTQERFTIRSVCIFTLREADYIQTVADISQGEAVTGVMRDLKIPINCIKSIRRLS